MTTRTLSGSRKLSAKSLKIKRRAGYHSIVISIVHPYRNYNGVPTWTAVWTYPTIRSNQIHDRDVQTRFWLSCEIILKKLENAGYMKADLEAIRNRFETVIPLPTAGAIFKPKTLSTSTLASLGSRYPLIRD